MTERTISRICENCGAEFSVIPSRIKHRRGKHCSPACHYTARRAMPKRRVQFTCIHCAKQFELSPSIVKSHRGAGKYCSRQCRDQHWFGPNTPNWQNGSGVHKRGPRWYATRRRILRRDKVCQHCGAGLDLHVHHRIPARMFGTHHMAANADWNLIVLCSRCHRIQEAKFKWVRLPASGGMLRFSASGPAWQMARDRGLV
jgi:5-methylcytosine-specific restriction endonuclease McrA